MDDFDENLCDLQPSSVNLTTKHFLSPATTYRTEYEDDFYYQQYYPDQICYEIPQSLTLLSAATSTISCEENVLQRTLAIIKPEFMQFQDVVLKKINDTGFSVINTRFLRLTPEQIADFYIDRYGCPSFPNLIISMGLGPFLVLSIADMNAIDKWKNIIGDNRTIKLEWFLPFSIRSRFGLHVDILNALHASIDLNYANRENRYFFPESTYYLYPVMLGDDLDDRSGYLRS